MSPIALTVVSSIYGGLLLSIAIWDSLSLQTDIFYDGLCFCGLTLPLGVLIPLSIYMFFKRVGFSGRSHPLIVNLTTLILCGVIVISNAVWNVSFFWHYREYASALLYVESQIQQYKINTKVILPPEYANLTSNGLVSVVVEKKEGNYLVIFPTMNSIEDHLVYAYVFAPTLDASQTPDECQYGGVVRPTYPHWYDCLVYDWLLLH